jgi:PAS domain S-box-containing protein
VTLHKPPLPPDEPQRLEALAQYGILDTPPEQEFDDLTRLATFITGTPMALVSIVESKRQWYKSKIGVEATETPREFAFCAHAILGRDLFVVPDAKADERFADNPLVTDHPFIRFYAGMPLTTPEGHALGTLCVLDRVPRQLTDAQSDALRALGRHVNAQLDLRRNMLKLVSTYGDLAETQEKLAAVLNSATSVGIIATNTEGVITLFNPGAERLLGYKAEEMIGKKSPTDFMLESELEERAAELGRRFGREIHGLGYFAELARHGIHEEREWAHVRKDGTRLLAKLAVMPLHDASDQIIGFLGVAKDLTERKRFEQQLIHARESAEDASRAKSEFLANISHEIRTPLNAILGMTELAMGTSLSLEQREYIAAVHDAGRSLLSLVNDVLDFSRIEARKLELYAVEIPLRETLADVLRTFGLRAYQKGLELVLQVPPDVPGTVCTDVVRLRQILTNLVANAIKFTERGEVVVRAAVDLRRENEAIIHFAVADTGIGVPREKQSLIFDPFTQAESATNRKYGGSGLGLAISKELVEVMGGQMWVDSVPKRGSTFHFTLPMRCARSEPSPSAAALRARLAGLAVLVADDNKTQRDALVELLESYGMKPATAVGGRAAVAALEKAASEGRRYDFVVLDAFMPDLDGFAVAAHLHAMPAFSRTGIVLLTVPGMPDTEARRLALGIEAAASKPIRESALLEALEEALKAGAGGSAPRRPSVPPPPAREPHSPLRILLIEDNLVNQVVTARILEKEGHSVAVAENGRRGLEAYARERFDAILMDVQMPGMDGLETTRAIRAREGAAQHTPVIAFTAHALKEDRERCLAAGMDAYLAKPVETSVLLETITALTGGAPAEAATRPHSATPPSDPADIYLSAMRRIVGDDEKLLREVIQVFLEDSPGKLSTLELALANRDAHALAVAAHAVKGSAAALGARHAVDAAARLEELARAANLAEADIAAAQVKEEIGRVSKALSDWLAAAAG